MVFDILNTFQIKVDISLPRNEVSTKLDLLFIDQLRNISKSISVDEINGVVVQGDTHSTLTGAFWGVFNHIPVFHVEAGLRSGNHMKPFPEELNRRIVGICAYMHFCPTSINKENLFRENINKNIFVVGNTVVDAQKVVLKEFNASKVTLKNIDKNDFELHLNDNDYFVFTGHRREALDAGNLEKVLNQLKIILLKYPDLKCIFPVHKNPIIRKLAKKILSQIKNLFLLEPISYVDFTKILYNARFFITDSGGIQEEAVGLSKIVLITRDVTERPEVLISGAGILVGENGTKLLKNVDKIMMSSNNLNSKIIKNPFGNGHASQKIVKHITNYYQRSKAF